MLYWQLDTYRFTIKLMVMENAILATRYLLIYHKINGYGKRSQ